MTELRYRRLAVEDFRADSPPRTLTVHGPDLQAGSCLRVAWPAGLHVLLTRASSGTIAARVEPPSFFATFTPECSWLSPDAAEPEAAIRHEQVHFAITEHFARELTGELVGESVRGRGETADAALAELAIAMRQFADRAMRQAAAEHALFDAETRSDDSGVRESGSPGVRESGSPSGSRATMKFSPVVRHRVSPPWILAS